MASSDPELERHIAETKQCCADAMTQRRHPDRVKRAWEAVRTATREWRDACRLQRVRAGPGRAASAKRFSLASSRPYKVVQLYAANDEAQDNCTTSDEIGDRCAMLTCYTPGSDRPNLSRP
eukprot:6204164-Pleurochrysis_carterae.AAC.1